MLQNFRQRFHELLDATPSPVEEFILHSKYEAHSRLAKVAILRKGRSLYKWLNVGIRDLKQKHTLVKQLRDFTFDQLSWMPVGASRFVESLQVKGEPVGRYYYSARGTTPLLYASVYGALLFDLLNKVDELAIKCRQEWVDYINSFQCEDGLYRDYAVENNIAETADWWGWRHVSAHVVSALTALGGKPRCPFRFLGFLYGAGNAYHWICELPWRECPADVSNTVMNYGVLLQYERDFWHNSQAEAALAEIFTFLDENINAETGLWCWSGPGNPQELSLAVQTSYHLWNLYFYDHRTIPHMARGIDSCLATQNRWGGFGPVYNSSACEDIDSIDPLCRFYFLTDYRHADLEHSLRNALRWVAVNQMVDGGFVFRRFAGFEYGHVLMKTDPDESSLFATWFRMLSIGYIGQVFELPILTFRQKPRLRCPGYQFWVEPNREEAA